MDIQKDHVVHLENGRFAAGSSRDELNRILSRALDANSSGGLVLHFHGGLVDETSARGIADRLAPIYATSGGAYPLFFVWESGVWETIWNNLGEIRRENFFQELVKKVGEWVLKKLPSDIAVRGAGGGLIDEKKLRHEFDAWFSETSPKLPDPVADTDAAPTGRSKGTAPDEKRLAEQIEAALDKDFKAAVEAVYNGLNPKGQDQPASRGVGSRASVQSLVSPEAADAMFDRSAVKTRGVLSWAKVSLFVAKIAIACIKRLMNGRGHGMYPTLVEEVLRAAYGDKIGAFIWNSMKTDTADAFKQGEETGGFALLDELHKQAKQGRQFSKITLIGHSTGAIYICHLLASAATQLPGQKFDVVFLAPAVTHELFAKTLAQHRDLVGHFRMFGMRDAVECEDRMVKILYTRSLLYFVSGLLEPEIDIPLVGMQRYLNETDVFKPADFSHVAAVADFLGQQPDGKVWSVTSAGPGTSSHAQAHGDFDNDEVTLESVAHILSAGF
jgi:hypothetical protein